MYLFNRKEKNLNKKELRERIKFLQKRDTNWREEYKDLEACFYQLQKEWKLLHTGYDKLLEELDAKKTTA